MREEGDGQEKKVRSKNSYELGQGIMMGKVDDNDY